MPNWNFCKTILCLTQSKILDISSEAAQVASKTLKTLTIWSVKTVTQDL